MKYLPTKLYITNLILTYLTQVSVPYLRDYGFYSFLYLFSLPPARHLHVSNLVPCQKKSPSVVVFFISTSYHRIPNLAQLVAFSKQVFTIIVSTPVKTSITESLTPTLPSPQVEANNPVIIYSPMARSSWPPPQC